MPYNLIRLSLTSKFLFSSNAGMDDYGSFSAVRISHRQAIIFPEKVYCSKSRNQETQGDS